MDSQFHPFNPNMLVLWAVKVFAVADFFEEVVNAENYGLLFEFASEVQVVVDVFAHRDAR